MTAGDEFRGKPRPRPGTIWSKLSGKFLPGPSGISAVAVLPGSSWASIFSQEAFQEAAVQRRLPALSEAPVAAGPMCAGDSRKGPGVAFRLTQDKAELRGEGRARIPRTGRGLGSAHPCTANSLVLGRRGRAPFKNTQRDPLQSQNPQLLCPTLQSVTQEQ